jgi:hypothetical protein
MSKISQYSPAATLTGVELIPAVQGGDTKTTTPSAIYTYVFNGFGANTFPARSSSGALAAKPITDFALTLLDDADAATARTTLGAQALDGTLTALAGQNWAANSLPIGSAPDAVAQVAFAANTFPARGSTGNLVAKPITDFGLSLIDDANAAAALTTLGIPTLASGTYTPTIAGITNVSGSSSNLIQWMRVGNVVTVSGFVSVTATATGSTEFEITLPVASDFTQTYQCGGGGSNAEATLSPVHIIADVANNRAQLTFIAGTTGSRAVIFNFTYLVN